MPTMITGHAERSVGTLPPSLSRTADKSLCHPTNYVAALRASRTISISIASPASTSSSSVMRGNPLRRTAPPRASGGMWMKAARRGPLSASTASIARQLR